MGEQSLNESMQKMLTPHNLLGTLSNCLCAYVFKSAEISLLSVACSLVQGGIYQMISLQRSSIGNADPRWTGIQESFVCM